MDDDGISQATGQLRAEPARAQTVIVRWWHDDPRDPFHCRGTVRSIAGEQLGSFDEFGELVALLQRLVLPAGQSAPDGGTVSGS